MPRWAGDANWSAGTIHHAPELFRTLERRLGHSLEGTFYVDDSAANVDAARAAGLDAVRFTDAAARRRDLQHRGLMG